MPNKLAVGLCFLALAGCKTPEVVDVQAQRKEYEAITVDWLQYVEADPKFADDPSLTDAQREFRKMQLENRRLTAEVQNLRIRKLEEGVK